MTNRVSLRAPPSGKRISPLPAIGSVGWDVSAPLLLEVLPAGHPPGVYTFALMVFVRTAAGAGNLNSSVIGWSFPGLGPTTASVGVLAPTSTGRKAAVYRSLASNGLTPITYALTPAGITGAPVIDVAVYALLTASNPP